MNQELLAAGPGGPFGLRYFHRWWQKASENLGIAGVDLLEAPGIVRSAIARGNTFRLNRPSRIMLGSYKTLKRYCRIEGENLRLTTD